MVICSFHSNVGYDSGRIPVFDFASLTLRAISDAVVDNGAWTGLHHVKLRDVEGNNRMQIVIGADSYYDGAIEIYRLDSNNVFTRIWTNIPARQEPDLLRQERLHRYQHRPAAVRHGRRPRVCRPGALKTAVPHGSWSSSGYALASSTRLIAFVPALQSRSI